MNFSCFICHGRFEQTDKIFSTKCGHIFHFACLSDWLKRLNTCPQCGEHSSDEIHRLYFFTFNNDTTIRNNDSVLQEHIENLEFRSDLEEEMIRKNSTIVKLRKEIEQKDRDISKYKQRAYSLETKLNDLKDVILHLEDDITRQSSKITELKQQIEQKDKDTSKYKQQAELLETKLNDLKDVILHLEDDITRQSSKITELKQQIEQKDKDTSKYKQQAELLETKLNDLEEEYLENRRDYKIVLEEMINHLNDNNVQNNEMIMDLNQTHRNLNN